MELSMMRCDLPRKLGTQIGRSGTHQVGLLAAECETSGRRRRPAAAVIAAKRKAIEGASEEMNRMASQNMDFATVRRQVRAAFSDTQEHLDHFLFKMAPTGIETEERYERSSKGLEIFWKSWLPRPGVSTKGTLFFCHGYGDTCTFFFEGIAKRIADAGYGVYAMDYPGFGLSEGLHGFIPSFDEMVDQVIEQYARIIAKKEVRGLPHFLLGQSMGGAVALKVHLKQPKEWDGIILVAPMCKIAEDVTPPGPVLKVLTLASYVLPQAKLFPQKDLAELALRDPEKRKMVSSPFLVLHGAADKVTDPTVSKFLYDSACSEDKTLKLYEGSYHSLLEGEPDDRISSVIGDIISWLDSRSAAHV